MSACPGWTAHEITAHLTGAAAEIIRHLQPYLQGEPVPRTQSFEVREAPFQAMDDATLRRRLELEEHKMRELIDRVLSHEPDAVIPWTGRQMVVAKFIPHLRNEFAIHRWAFAGDTDPANDLLAQPDLIEHSVGVLGQLLLRAGRARDPNPDEDFHVRLRAQGATDVRLVVAAGEAELRMADDDSDDGEPYVELDPAARSLVIWGRRPDQRGRFTSHLPASMLARLQALLSGY